jgi:hypothetical protein
MDSLNTITNQSVTSTDWSSYYSDLQKKGNVPNASAAIINKNSAIFRDLYLDLATIKDNIRTSGFTPAMITIYADVLNISDFTNVLLASTGMVIYARRIEVSGSATIILDYQNDAMAQVVIFASEMIGTLTVSASKSSQEQPQLFNISQDNVTPGITINNLEGNVSSQPLSLSQGIGFQLSKDMQLYLNNAFIYGSLLYDQNQDLSLSMFLWTKGWAAQASELEELFYRSTSLVTLLSSQINATATGAVFVPYLTSSIYTMLANAFAKDAAKYESDYMAVTTQEVLTAQNIAIAKTMVANTQSEIDFVNALLKQANDNYNNAVAATNKAQLNFLKQQIKVSGVSAQFEQIGIPDYQREQIIKAVFSLVTAVITFGGAIALMAVGDPAAAPAAAGAAVNTAKTVATAADTAADVAKTASSLADAMSNLKKLVEALQKVYELAKAVKEVASNISDAKNQTQTIQAMSDTTDGADLSAADGWAIFKIQADSVLQDPIDKGIGYAADYKQELDILVVYGQSLSASQLAVIKAGQEMASITFQLHYAQAKQANLQQLVNNLQVGDTLLVETQQQLYQKYIDSKSSLFSALKSYQASYYYWALTNSGVHPKIVDSVNDLNAGIQNITAIAMDTANALEQFNPPPQSMSNILFEITDTSIINTLQTTGQTTWILPLNEVEFQGLNRVRLSKIRVWLEGAVVNNKSDSIYVNITTAGNYLDRYQNQNYQFGSKPLTRAFKYMIASKGQNPNWKFENDSYGFVQVDGSVDQEVAYAYFQPTPFSEWTISLTSNNPNLDYSKISKITMYFEGSAIGQASLSAKRKTI